VDECGQRVNDIILPQNDLCASRVHCKIQYKNALAPRRPLPNFTMFLLCLRRKDIPFPRHLLLLVYSLVRQSTAAFVKDLNSLSGTYLRVRADRPQILKPLMMFLIAPGLFFSVREIFPSLRDFLMKEITKRPGLSSLNRNSLLEEVFKGVQPVLARPVNDAYDFELNYFDKPCIRIVILDGDLSQKMEVNQEYIIPCDDLATINEANDRVFTVTAGPEQFKTLLIVNKSECAFEIGYSYEKQQWSTREVGGTFGLWCSVGGSKMEKSRFAKGKMEIKNGDEIKISTTILSVRWPVYWNGEEWRSNPSR
jgi:hypothetical protein